MSKPAFFAFAGKELMRPGMKPFTIGIAANFLIFAAIPSSGETLTYLVKHVQSSTSRHMHPLLSVSILALSC